MGRSGRGRETTTADGRMTTTAVYTTPRSCRSAIAASSKPRPARISSLCSPSSGGALRIAPGVRSKSKRDARLAQDAECGVLDGRAHAEGRRFRRVERGHDVGDGRARDLGRFQVCQPGRAGPAREDLGQDRPQLGPVLDAVAVGREAWIGRQLRPPEGRTQPDPLALGPDRHGQLAVGGGEGLVRHDVGVGVAAPSRGMPGDEPVLRLVDEDREGGGQERRVDPLATSRLVPVPLEHGRQDADDGIQPGDDVADRDADLGRVPTVGVGVPGDRHQPGRGLDHEVVARSGRGRSVAPVAADRQVDQPGMRVAQPCLVDPEPGEGPWPKVLHEDVGVVEQPAQDGAAVGCPQVEPDRALVAIDGQEVGGRPRPIGRVTDPRRTPRPGRVAVGRLDLDHVGAEVGQEHRRVRTGEDRRRVDDAQATQRSRVRWLVGGVRHRSRW